MTTTFHMPVVTTHREKSTGITRVAVDGTIDPYFSVEKRGKLFYVRMHDESDPDDVPGWSCGYDTHREALAECVDRIVRDRR